MAKILTTLKAHKGKLILLGVLTAAVAASIAGKAPLEVSMGAAKAAAFTTYVEEAARVKAAESRPVVPLVAGEVVKVLVEPGDQVKVGTVLAQIDATDLEFEERRLQSSLNAARAQLAQARTGAGSNALKALEADLKAAQLDLKEAERQWQKAKQLYANDAMSQDEYEQAKAKVDSAKTGVARAQANLNEAKTGGTANEIKQLEEQVKGIEASLDLIRTQAGRTQLISPIEGTVLEKNISVGAMVQPGTEAFILGQLDNLLLRAEVLADDAIHIAKDQTVEISGAVLEGKALKGKVNKVYPQAIIKVSSLGIEQQRVPVEIKVEGTLTQLKPNYEVEARIITGSKAKTLTVPEGAVFKVKGKDHVFVVQAGVVQLKSVTTGLKNPEEVEILEGLKEGDQVILYPSSEVKEGIKVAELKQEMI